MRAANTRRSMPLGERGSSPVEFLFVGVLLTALTLAVIQLGLAIYVRNVVHDAAAEGAHRAALVGAAPGEGIATTRDAVIAAVGPAYADDIVLERTTELGAPTIRITVRTTLPVIGLVGVPGALEVSGRAPIESFDDF
ncbi:hypothetical protein GCM10025768_16820 [Microbacterium pseudoresistens]|uniref:Flp pilus assembly protein TadG n=1 Tax=Microbacterium pseudoresistens TaxID=640634 RepID=A0A7Y9ES68_9MICO|nr:TadE/TadG family type IV pilus assembly protein [Microbacterium pseudoresistens]NYD52965.1 Flp pilus assembly protein TadG [Microbacterium pseudoresistens]